MPDSDRFLHLTVIVGWQSPELSIRKASVDAATDQILQSP